MEFSESGNAPGSEGKPAAREQLVAVAVDDTLLILGDLERRNAIDPWKAADIRWTAIRVTGEVSAEENKRFWSNYAQLVVLSERLGHEALAPTLPSPAQHAPAAPRRVRLWRIARYGAVAATLCAVVLALDNTSILIAPRQDEPPPVAVAANDPVLAPALEPVRPVVAVTVVEAEPTYYIAYGRDHPNFPQPAPLPARFDPPQADM